MKRRNYLGRMVFVVLAFLVLAAAGTTIAASQSNTESVLSAGETFSGTYNRAAAVVRIGGTVNGNVFVVGNDISVDGDVNGDVYAAGQNISIKGKVSGTVHAAGANVNISGQVGNMLLAAGSTINVSKDAKIGRGLMSAGSVVDIRGPIGGAMYTAASDINIDSVISGDTSLTASRITLGKDARIEGNLKYNDSAQATIANDGGVTGSITKYHVSESKQKAFAELSTKVMFGIVSSFIIGLVMILIAPGTAVATAEYIHAHSLKSILVGLAVLITTPILAVLLLVTVFGITLAVVLGMLYVATLMLSNVFVALWLGRRISSTVKRKVGPNIWALLIGLVVLQIVTVLPVIGGLFGFVALVAGLGAITARSYDRLKVVRTRQIAAS